MTSNQKIRIDQFLAGFSQYDAISNEALIMQEALRKQGFLSEIFAEHLHPKVEKLAKKHHRYRPDQGDLNIAIYHFSIGSALTTFLAYQPTKVIVRYHNVTPPDFFSLPSDRMAYDSSLLGRKQIAAVDQMAECLIAASEYNLKDFRKKPGRIELVIPILRDYSKLTSLGDDVLFRQNITGSAKLNWLFVGRIAPNKAQHDLIETLKIYHETVGKKVRLILIGSFFSSDYKNLLVNFCANLGLKVTIGLNTSDYESDVIFLSNASDETLVTAYRNCDLFLCLSDHEGFCVPIVEAMSANLPVIAFDSSAISSTATTGIIIKDKKNKISLINALLSYKAKESHVKTPPTHLTNLELLTEDFVSNISLFISSIRTN